MSLAAGDRVGAYEVLGALGAGGMGEVYRARDTRLGRAVALKVLSQAFALDGDRLARFDREAKTLAVLDHPHIARVYGVEEHGPVRALVLELVEGATLAERIARGPIAVREALAIAAQIAEALDAMHEQGILHRDLKPSNVKLRPDGVAKVLDFGLAKALAGDGSTDEEASTLTQTGTRPGTVLGTAAYMSPEQARGQRLDRRTDIWSFGCVVYEMLTGRRAFAGATRSDTIASVLEREPDWHALPAATPAAVRRLLRRCLEKDVKRRLRDIGDAAPDLAGVVEPAAAAGAGPPGTRRAGTWIGIAASLALVGATGAAIVLWPGTGDVSGPALTAVPLTTYPGVESHPSLSPDGNHVAFTWTGEREDNLDVYVKLVGPGTPLRLTSDPSPDTSPAWSPDGRWIAFLRTLPSRTAAITLVPSLGGPERRLGEIGAGPFLTAPDFGPWLCWSRDGAFVILSHYSTPSETGGLFAWSVATGERHRLTTPPPRGGLDATPAMSPDGRSLVFTRFVGFGIGDLHLLALDEALRPAGDPKRLTRLNRFTTSPAWLPDGREIVFSAGSLTGGAASLYAIQIEAASTERAPLRLTSIGEHAGVLSISRAAGSRPRMVYTHSHFDAGIWQVALPGAQERSAPAAADSVPFLLSTRPEYLPQYSPDGRHVAFVSAASGESEIWVADENGANLVQLTFAGWPETASPRWAPDGARIAFHSRPEGPGDLFTVPASGGAPKRFTDDPADDWGAAWSADGRIIFFTSTRSGRSEIWKAPVDGGAPVQLSRKGGHGPTVSPDGLHVYYTKGQELWKIAADGGDETLVLESVGDWSRVAVVEDGIFFIPAYPLLVKRPSEYTIDFFSFSSARRHTVARFDKSPYLGLSASPDGSRLLYTQIDLAGADLMLVEDLRRPRR